MATQTDVTNALMSMIKSAVYTDGTGSPSIVTRPVKVVTGTANSLDLTATAKGDQVLVIVYRSTDSRPLYSFIGEWTELERATSTIGISVINNTIQFSGEAFTPANILVKVNNIPYHYVVKDTDTIEAITAAVAVLIPGAIIAFGRIIIPNAYKIETGVSVVGTAIRSVGDIQEGYWIDVYANNDADRQAVALAIDIYLRTHARFNLVDGVKATLGSQVSKIDFDKSQKVGVYRATLKFLIAYQLTQKQTFTTITDFRQTIVQAESIN